MRSHIYQMPTYFQVVRGASAAESGVLCLPFVVAFFVSILIGSSATGLVGYYKPFMIVTSILTPISAGLLTTLHVKQSLGSLIGYQAFLGVGAGLGFQGPQVAAQAVLSASDSPIGIAMIIFAQNFGPAVFVSVAQTIFTEQLQVRLGAVLSAPDVSLLTSSAGLTNLTEYVPAGNLMQVVEEYDKALTTVFFLPVGLACASMVGALGMEWVSVKRKRS